MVLGPEDTLGENRPHRDLRLEAKRGEGGKGTRRYLGKGAEPVSDYRTEEKISYEVAREGSHLLNFKWIGK